MANGSNGKSTLQVVTPQAIEEPGVGLVPQMHAQPVASLFGDQRIFVNAPQYHWHVQGAMGVDEEARQHMIALAQRLYEFGHRTEDCEMEIWHRLGSTVELPELERQVAKSRQVMANEYDQFVQKLSDFVNQEFSQFGQRLTLLEGTSHKIQDIGTQTREVSQAMVEWVDKVEGQMMSIRSTLKKEAYLAVEYKANELKTKFLAEVDQKMTALETCLMYCMNEDCQTMAIRLQEIRNLVAAV